jgi:hypothetical protein
VAAVAGGLTFRRKTTEASPAQFVIEPDEHVQLGRRALAGYHGRDRLVG